MSYILEFIEDFYKSNDMFRDRVSETAWAVHCSFKLLSHEEYT